MATHFFISDESPSHVSVITCLSVHLSGSLGRQRRVAFAPVTRLRAVAPCRANLIVSLITVI